MSQITRFKLFFDMNRFEVSTVGLPVPITNHCSHLPGEIKLMKCFTLLNQTKMTPKKIWPKPLRTSPNHKAAYNYCKKTQPMVPKEHVGYFWAQKQSSGPATVSGVS